MKLLLRDTRDTMIFNVYRPPDGDIQAALDYLENIIGNVTGDSNPDIIVAGDFNIDLLKNTAQSKMAKTFANNLLLTQLVKSATRVTNSGKSLIDHIYVSNVDFSPEGNVTDAGLSDHCMTYTTRQRLKIKHPASYTIGRSYRNFDPDLFAIDIARLPWTAIYACKDVNTATELFTKMILTTADKHAPFKTIKSRENQPKWITSEFLSLVDYKHHTANVH